MASPKPSLADIAGFLAGLHAEPVVDLEPLSGGFWSSAFGYRVGDRSLVVRLGKRGEGFEMDRAAMAFGGPDLPVPTVLDIGRALGMAYAISERHHGRFLEDVEPDEVDRSGPALMRLLAGLRSVPSEPSVPVSWEPGAFRPARSWRDWLTRGLVDDRSLPVSGWRTTLAADPDLDRLFVACEQRVADLLDACPERRDLVHGDLLHQNVLVADDSASATAIFSWKCSVRGDFLFDAAWCTFWAGWYPGIEAVDVWGRTIEWLVGSEALVDAAIRHHCYELQIGASHFGWNVWTGNADELDRTADRTAEVLERGPLPYPESAVSPEIRPRP